MNKVLFICLISILISSSFSLRWGLSHITLNSSHSKSTVSVSLSTNIKEPFTIESNSFVNTQDHLSTLTPNNQDNLIIQPLFISDQETLYNDFSQNQYWLGFKKTFENEGQPIDVSDFDIMKVHIQQKNYTMLLPMFGLPLSFINANSLFRCQNVLVSYEIVEQQISLSVFSKDENWIVKPHALWGFRHHDHDVFYGRSVHSISDVIQIFINQNDYCIIESHNMPKNTNTIKQTNKLSVKELLDEVSVKLQTRSSKTANTSTEEL